MWFTTRENKLHKFITKHKCMTCGVKSRVIRKTTEEALWIVTDLILHQDD